MSPPQKVRSPRRSSSRLRLTLRSQLSWTRWRLSRTRRRLAKERQRLVLLQRLQDSSLLLLKQLEVNLRLQERALQELAESKLFRETGLVSLQEQPTLPRVTPPPGVQAIPPPPPLPLSPEETSRLIGLHNRLRSQPSSDS